MGDLGGWGLFIEEGGADQYAVKRGLEQARMPALAHFSISTAGTTIPLILPPTGRRSSGTTQSEDVHRERWAASSSTANRMVKLSASFVLASRPRSPYPVKSFWLTLSHASTGMPLIILRAVTALAASMEGLFDHPADSLPVVYNSRVLPFPDQRLTHPLLWLS